jgi:hypothetical protein
MAYDLIVANGEGPEQITLAAAAKCGQLIGYSSGWKLSNAATGTAIPAEFIAGQSGAIGDVITVWRRCTLWDRDAPFTAGSLYWVDEAGGPGGITATMPSTTGDIQQSVGIAVSTERVTVDLNNGYGIRKIA